MSSHPDIRVALIGYGYAGKTFHAPLIRAVPGLSLNCIGTSKPEVVEAAFPGMVVCPPDQVPTLPEIDLVVIATPNESHFPLAAAALRAGKDVVVDKPFTLTLAEARELVQIAKQHSRRLSVFHNRRWFSEVLATREILASGILGHVSHYECHMDRFRPHVRERWRELPGPGAGLWFDLGPHLIDQALHLFGLPHSVNASFAILREGGKTDDWAHIQLNYDKLRVILHASLLVSGGAPRSILHGNVASWAKYGSDTQEAQLIAGMDPNAPEFGIDSDPGIVFFGSDNSRKEIPMPVSNQKMYYAELRDAIRNNQPAPISGEHGVAVMAILEASFESGRASGQTLPIPLTPQERALWV